MSTTDIVIMMSADEAREKTTFIRQSVHDIGKALQDIKERRGWEALGYTTWTDYIQHELNFSKSHLYRLMFMQAINDQLDEQLIERQARPLKALDAAPERRKALDIAKRLAKAERSELNSRHVAHGVRQVKEEKIIETYPIVQHIVASGDLSHKNALVMIRELDKLNGEKADVVRFIGKHTVTDPNMIPKLADMVHRKSETLLQIDASGEINNKPIREANLTDLGTELYYAAREKESVSIERKRQQAKDEGKPIVIGHAITVWENDPEKTYKALSQALPASDMHKLLERMLQDVYNDSRS